MANLRDIIAYLLKAYPDREDLTNGRVTKMVYLADWRSCILNGRQISTIEWYFNDYGPFVWDVKEAVESRPDIFRIKSSTNYFGSPKTLFDLRSASFNPDLSADEKEILDHVVRATAGKNWKSFKELVYSTFPIVKSERYTYLDLVDFARKYNPVQGETRG